MSENQLEWLSLNWRKYRASQLGQKLKTVILRMWEENYEYFPTLREIKDGLAEGQLKILQEDKDKWEATDDHQGNK